MKIIVSENPNELGMIAGQTAGQLIREAIEKNGQSSIIVATGGSQTEMLKQLITEDIDWSKVIVFHLDEYIGMSETSPASFRKYLKERFLNKVGKVKDVYFVNGEGDPAAECRRLNDVISQLTIDVALVGIGENGHLAFNDPPADFETEEPYIVVSLDEKCRRQQTGEGWFKSIEDVPEQAISMSVKQICKSRHIICSVPDSRKAEAVRDCLEKPVSNMHPAGILQLHNSCYCFLDKLSSALLTNPISELERAITNQTLSQ
ncbi:MAG: glucosamine-6-phosphate deaminase [Chitinophagaceae bacterium]